MTYASANAPVAADFDVRELVIAAIRRAAAAVRAAARRADERKCYRTMLQHDELLRDTGITREQLRQALADW